MNGGKVKTTLRESRPTPGLLWFGLIAVAVVLPCGQTPIWAADQVADAPEVVQQASGGLFEAVLFYLFAAVAIVSTLAICITGNIVRMAVYLFVTLSAVAVLYFLLLANFIAVIQLIVYVGGTLVLLIFGVMLTSKSPWARFDVSRNELLLAGGVGLILLAALVGMLLGTDWPGTPAAAAAPVADLGRELLQTYLVPFEAASVLLLVVMIGAAYLARQEKD